ncbi:hypothetical protein [Neoaquamicrobium sediminum]|uniref:hypothetical protein n=2 Tax=Neoaquamicrobium sediminum TaxID=1849104 RepID=UPI00361185A8
MRRSTKTFAAAAAFAASLAAAPLYAQDTTESGSGAMMEGGGMMGQDGGANGMMGGQDGMAGMMNMMTQMNEMMTTCNKMMQAMMDGSGKDMPGSQDATPEKDG